MNDNKILLQIENIEKALKELRNIIAVSSEDSEKEQTVSDTITEEVFNNLPARYIAEKSAEESDDEEYDPDEFYIEDEVLYDYFGKREEVTIPYGIRKIGKSAFQNNQTLKKVNFPETLREIGENAFLQCSNLVEVNNSKKVRKIGAWAFERCYRLEKIDVDSVKCVCFCAFENCTSLEMLMFSENTEMIEDYAFCNCKNLVVSIPQTCEAGENAFTDCKSVEVEGIGFVSANTQNVPETTPEVSYAPEEFDIENRILYKYLGKNEEVTIPYGVTKIEHEAFRENMTIKKVNFPDTVTEIGEYAFYRCQNLVEVNNSKNVTRIGEYVFCDCSELEKIDVDNVIEIGSSAFISCESLQELIFSKNIKTIGECAFYYCKNLNVSIPETCETGRDAFYGCKDVELRH